jgi:hypothetical protein
MRNGRTFEVLGCRVIESHSYSRETTVPVDRCVTSFYENLPDPDLVSARRQCPAINIRKLTTISFLLPPISPSSLFLSQLSPSDKRQPPRNPHPSEKLPLLPPLLESLQPPCQRRRSRPGIPLR